MLFSAPHSGRLGRFKQICLRNDTTKGAGAVRKMFTETDKIRAQYGWSVEMTGHVVFHVRYWSLWIKVFPGDRSLDNDEF